MHVSKKLAVIAASGLATITVAGGAFAYFTATGTGSGVATAGTSSPWLIDNVTTGGGALTPGGFQQAIYYRITNVGSGGQHLNDVDVTVKSDADGNVEGAPGCLASWFSVMTSWQGTDWAPLGSFQANESRNSTGVSDGRGAVISLNNADVNQDACQSKSIPVLISAS